MENIRSMVNINLFTDSQAQCFTIEKFFRISLEELCEREWVQIIQREMKERSDLIRSTTEYNSETIFSSFPPIIQLTARGFVWMCMFIMSFYFLIATLFFSLLGVLTSLYIFFSMFSKPYNVFPYGIGFLVTLAQFTILCSRGFDVARNISSGKLIEALRAFGNKALFFQVLICVFGAVGLFVLFCVMATRYDVMTGIQYSLAYGWICAACLIFIYHVVFAFGVKAINKPSYNHGSRVNNAETALYLIMDLDIDDNYHVKRPFSEILTISLIGLLTVAAGVSNMAGGGIFLPTGRDCHDVRPSLGQCRHLLGE
ncbi:hypothetical protein AGDE_14270 [Angomonas deanei]|uniref:Uncharacterized protein n=1 Tax=Angomonas deanei TaxID=59799 RepID=A0A7G2C2Y4_9TRYP|nr:hypothetical protein AGDE_14270 [Angomonas deanei]CAD2214036.1 hypothetical protein, conserved [Angomonas deanei]|eukprot:EPY21126.1 hypothetical protein AGDE_14270 [Angomonas deanei]